jgi:hypothetical protein
MKKVKICPYACREDMWGSGGTSPVILNMATSLK